MTTENEQADLLADQAASALTAARGSLIAAADVTEEVDGLLRRSEDHILELSGQARKVRDADEPGPYLRNAQGIADDIDRRLRNGQRGLDEVRDHLHQCALALNAGRQILTELEQLPGQQGEATDRLGLRLDGLERAVRDAGEGIDEAGTRLAAARRNVEPLLYSHGHIDDPRRTAALIDEAGASVDGDVTAARRRFRGLGEEFDATRQNATHAAQQSADLAMAVRAGLNPPSGSGQSSSTDSSEMDLRRRNSAPAQGVDRDR